MNTSAMAAGRAAAAERRQAAERVQLSEYREWLTLEAETFGTYRRLLEMFGPAHPDARAAREAWRIAAELMPKPSADSVWRRERGDEQAPTDWEDALHNDRRIT